MNTPQNRLGRLRAQAGYSLMEVLVAMFVIVVGIAGVTATLYWGTQHQDSGKVMTEASNLARIYAESVRTSNAFQSATNTLPGAASGLNDPPAARRALNYGTTFASWTSATGELSKIKGQSVNKEDIQSNLGRFTKNIASRLLPVGSTVLGHEAGMVQMTVRIYWNEKGHERNVAIESIVPF